MRNSKLRTLKTSLNLGRKNYLLDDAQEDGEEWTVNSIK